LPLQAGEALGSAVSLATLLVHVPAALPQDLHAAVQASAQQRPSTQYPVAQSLASSQLCPCLALHAPAPSHTLFPPHAGEEFASVLPLTRLVVQVPAAFAHDLHGVVHVLEQHVPSTQLPLAHSLPPEHPWPLFFLQTGAAALEQMFVPLQVAPLVSSAFLTGLQLPG
jgi:hypothetical protein